MRRTCLLLVATVIMAGAIVGPALAQDEEPSTEDVITGISGTLNVGDEPVEGVGLLLLADGEEEEISDTVSDADGIWLFEIEDPGRYQVTVDVETLPEGVELRDPERDTLSLSVRVGRTTQALFRLVGEDAPGLTGRGLPARLAQASINGVKFGLIIAMTAIGLSLIFGTTGLVNFAHAEMVTFGAVIAWFLNTTGPRLHLVYAALIAIVLGSLLGAFLERGMFRPLRSRQVGKFQLLVITIGLGIVIRQAILIWFGPNSRPYRDFRIQSVISFGPVSITPRDVGIIVISLVTLVLVGLLLQKTKVGKAMRAVSDNIDLAESSGIDVRRIILAVWAVGGGLAALGGVLQASTTSVNYLMGFQLLLLMFAGVILGGLGTAYGAMVGSLVVGLTTEVSTVWLSAELKYVWALGVLIIVLLFRPQGILGTAERVG